LSGIGVVGHDDGDALGGRELEGVDEKQKLHEVLVDERRRDRLDDVDVGATHVILDLDVDLTVGEAAHMAVLELDAQQIGDAMRQWSVAVA